MDSGYSVGKGHVGMCILKNKLKWGSLVKLIGKWILYIYIIIKFNFLNKIIKALPDNQLNWDMEYQTILKMGRSQMNSLFKFYPI